MDRRKVITLNKLTRTEDDEICAFPFYVQANKQSEAHLKVFGLYVSDYDII